MTSRCDMYIPLTDWHRIGAVVVLVASVGCCHAAKSGNELSSPPDKAFEILTGGGYLALKEWPTTGPSRAEIQQLQLDKFRQLIDSSLMPHASPETRTRLGSIKSIIDRADRDGEVFLKDPDHFADFTIALADMILIAGTMYPGYLDLQLQVPSSLLMTANTLGILRDVGLSRDVGPNIATYTSEAVESARKAVDRFPSVGRVHGQLGFVLARTGGGKEESRRLYKRCIDMDSQAEFCKEGYRSLTRDGAK